MIGWIKDLFGRVVHPTEDYPPVADGQHVVTIAEEFATLKALIEAAGGTFSDSCRAVVLKTDSSAIQWTKTAGEVTGTKPTLPAGMIRIPLAPGDETKLKFGAAAGETMDVMQEGV